MADASELEQEVVVVNFQNGIAEVDTWDHFVNQEDQSHHSSQWKMMISATFACLT